MLAVVTYSLVPGAESRVTEVYPRHRAYLDAFQESTPDLLLIGPFGDGPDAGSMAVFRTRAAAERFTAGDPFVREGVAHLEGIRDWLALNFVTPAQSPSG